jgi:hypothetical protein
MKFCVDCRHVYFVDNGFLIEKCHHPSVTEVDLVTGKVSGERCSHMRYSSSKCGLEGSLWEPRTKGINPF